MLTMSKKSMSKAYQHMCECFQSCTISALMNDN